MRRESTAAGRGQPRPSPRPNPRPRLLDRPLRRDGLLVVAVLHGVAAAVVRSVALDATGPTAVLVALVAAFAQGVLLVVVVGGAVRWFRRRRHGATGRR